MLYKHKKTPILIIFATEIIFKTMLLDLIIIFTGTALIFAIGFLTTKKEKSC